MAQRSLKVVTAVGPSPAFASVTSRAVPCAKTACEAQARDRPSLAQRSFGRNFHAPSCLQRSPRRVDQATWPARAPEQSLAPQPSQLRLRAGNVSATLSVEIAAALASTMAQRSLKVVTAVGPSLAFASLASKTAPRAKAACEAQARARPPQSRAVKLWAQASAGATFTRQTLLRLNLLQLQRQRRRLNRCSLRLNYPPPLARGEVVAASRRLPAGLRKPQAAASQAPASPFEAV